MSWPEETTRTVNLLAAVERKLDGWFVGRGAAVRLMVLAAVCQEHLLLIGPPGTAKTDLISRFCGLVSATQFRYLLTRFTEPSEIFGPLDFQQFQAGTYRIRTTGMLPEADIVFLDEVFQGSSAILNTLLAVLNERSFDNGGTRQPARLVSLFGASSELPDDPALLAFADRFLLRLEVEPVARIRLHELLDRGWQHQTEQLGGGGVNTSPLVSVSDLAKLTRQLRHVRLTEVRSRYADVVAELVARGVALSDRRIVRGLKLVAGAALLRGADVAHARDLWPLRHIWTEPGDAEVTKGVLDDHLGAVEDGSGGRSVTALLELAHQRVRQLDDYPAGADGSAVMTTLRVLNQEVLQPLQRRHPREHAAIDTVRGLINQVTQRLRKTS